MQYRSIFLIVVGLTFLSCTKDIFQLQIEDSITNGKTTEGNNSSLSPSLIENKDYYIQLNGGALQINDQGRWYIKSGRLHEKFVYFENHTMPNTKFYGIPGEKYILEWVVNRNGKELREEIEIKIKSPVFRIENRTPRGYTTKIKLEVYQHLQGKWVVDKPFAWMNPRPPFTSSGSIERNPSIDIQGYENTDYHIKWIYTLFDKEFVLDTLIKTGVYQQLEALEDLGLTQDHGSVTWDKNKNVIAINLQSSKYAGRFDNWMEFPALKALKHIRKLNFYGSSLGTFPELFTQYYLDLEELNMDRTGNKIEIPKSINNLKKLKKFSWSNLWGSHVPLGRITYPEEFGELESLEELRTGWNEGIILPQSFGKLKNLKLLTGTYYRMPEDIGNLKNLKRIEAHFQTGGIVPSLANAISLEWIRFSLHERGEISLPSDIDKLQNLHYLEIRGEKHINDLPESFGRLNKLDTLWIDGQSVGNLSSNFGNLKNLKMLYFRTTARSLPNSFGNLTNLKNLSIYGQNLRALPESFGNLSNLMYADIGAGLESLPESFGNLLNLKNLSLDYNKLTTLPEGFQNLKMEKVSLKNNAFTKFPKELSNLENILVIDLTNNNIDLLPLEIVKLKDQLVYLYLHQNDLIPLDNLKDIARKMFGTIIYRNEFNSYQVN